MNYSTSRSSSPPSPASLRRRLVDELQRGHRAAEILRRRRFIRVPSTSPPVSGSEETTLSDCDLAETIWTSFNNGLSIARNCELLLDSRASDDCKVEDSCGGDGGDSASRIKDRRGCYKRRKRGETWTMEGAAPTEDGHQWRKYGQKMILNSEFPRNYYRCTHKLDQGCQATKQVQKVSDEPPLYKTIYSGNHTCKSPLKATPLIIPSSSPDQSESSFLLRFDGPSSTINPFFPSPHHPTMAIKQEQSTATATATAASQAMMNITVMMADYNCLPSSDPTTFLAGVPQTGLSTPAGSDHGGDVISAGAYSCSTSPHSLSEMDSYMFLGQDDHLDLIHYECGDQF